MRSMIDFCADCRYKGLTAKMEPCKLCLEYGLRWGAPVGFEWGDQEGDHDEKS